MAAILEIFLRKSYLWKDKHKLKEHVSTIHENYKPYQCADCGYAAGLKGNVKHHIKGKHKGANIEILFLGKEYSISRFFQNFSK